MLMHQQWMQSPPQVSSRWQPLPRVCHSALGVVRLRRWVDGRSNAALWPASGFRPMAAWRRATAFLWRSPRYARSGFSSPA